MIHIQIQNKESKKKGNGRIPNDTAPERQIDHQTVETGRDRPITMVTPKPVS